MIDRDQARQTIKEVEAGLVSLKRQSISLIDHMHSTGVFSNKMPLELLNMNSLQEIEALQEKIEEIREFAKTEAMNKVRAGLDELASLGFHFELKEKHLKTTRKPNIRQRILSAITSAKGLDRQGLFDTFNATDTKSKRQIDNALKALKESGKVTNDEGIYKKV